MDTAPEILKQKFICTCCKNIHTINVNSHNKSEKKLIITWERQPLRLPPTPPPPLK